MPEDYRPIPGQKDSGPSMNPRMDDLSVMAREKASNILSPYANMGGPTPDPNANPVPPPGTAGQPAPGAETGPSTEKMLYNSVPTDTLTRILDMIMQFVGAGKKPIPRQEGGPVEPDKTYTVGERGPETFKPAIPGQIIPAPTESGGLAYRGRANTGYGGADEQMDPFFSSTRAPRPTLNAGAIREKGLPYAFGLETPSDALTMKRDPTTGVYGVPGEGEAARGHEAPPSSTSPESPSSHVPGQYPLSGGFGGYGEGIRGAFTEPETAATRRGDQQARDRIAREGQGFVPVPGKGPGPGGSYLRSYYEAHPEEKSMDDLVSQYGHRDPKTGNITNLKELSELHRTNVEFGPQSIQSQERLARMDYEKAEAEAKRAGIPFDQYLKSAEAQKNLGEAAKSGFISGKWGVFHPATGQFFSPPGMEDKTTATTMTKLEAEAAKETGGDPTATRERLRSKVKSLVDMGLMKKADIPPQFFKMTKPEFMAALQKAKKVPKNQDELDMAYKNYMKIPIED